MLFQNDTYSVLLVSSSEKMNEVVTSLLPVTDYWPIDTVKSVNDARRKLTEESYDLIIINSPLPDGSGMRFSMDACAACEAGILLLVKHENYEDIYNRVLPAGVVTLSKPTNTQMISQNLRVLCAMRERLRRMKSKQATVEERIEEIRLINRAKWLLIECLHMTEPDAHRYIARQAMEQKITKRQAAENIIRTYQ
ncbi:MAG: ANTAR domain-containing protein [Oscillospiraceae bacterium]|nr:ANTAR domain-containing protein [Oscillospiraceae bacterium]